MTGLRARELDCAIGGRVILRGVDLAVAPGEVLGFVGPNGSGKSTLLRVLAGVRPPAAGQVLLDGEPLSALSARQRARRIALVGQEEELPADLLVGELVALGLIPHRAPWSGGDRTEREIVHKALSEVDLSEAIDRPVEQLSGGERKRVLLARGLAQDTPLLVLDEPTNHLDIRHQLHLLDLVRGLDRTVLIALHDLNLATDFCDRIVVLHNGIARPAAAPAEALTPELVREVFGVRATRVAHPDTGRPHLLFTPTLERP